MGRAMMRWRMVICAVAAIALCPAAGGADPSGDSVLAKYRAFVGWTLGDTNAESIRITGKIAGLTDFDETCQPDRFAQFNIGLSSGRPFLVASDGRSVWVSHDSVAHDLPNDVAQDELTQSLLLCNAFATFPATVVGEVAPAGTNSKSGYTLLSIQAPNAPPIIMSVNDDTGEPTSVVVNGIATYAPADLEAIDCKRKIYTRWKRQLPDGSTADMTISTLQLNVAADPAIFTRQAIDIAPSPDPAPVIGFTN